MMPHHTDYGLFIHLKSLQTMEKDKILMCSFVIHILYSLHFIHCDSDILRNHVLSK